MKTLVVYYSRTGNNKALAERVATELGAEVFPVLEKGEKTVGRIMFEMILGIKPRLKIAPPDASAYDLVLFMGPVWMFHVPSPLRSCFSRMRRTIRKYAYVSVSGGALGPNPGLARELVSRLGKKLVMLLDLNVAHLCRIETDPATGKARDYFLRDNPDDLERLSRIVCAAFDRINP